MNELIDIPVEGLPLGDFTHLSDHVDCPKTNYDLMLRAASDHPVVIIDTEGNTSGIRELMKHEPKVMVVGTNQDMSAKTLREAVDKMATEGKDLVVESPMPSRKLSTAAALSAIMAFSGMSFPQAAEKKMRKCGLPGCDVMHSHNGGYCKAEHCREHQKMIRESRIMKAKR